MSPRNRTESGSAPTFSDAEVSATAARELGSFLTAVAELYGIEQVHHAADDWLDEFASQPLPEAGCHWSITISAAARLAERLNGDACFRASLRKSRE